MYSVKERAKQNKAWIMDPTGTVYTYKNASMGKIGGGRQMPVTRKCDPKKQVDWLTYLGIWSS